MPREIVILGPKPPDLKTLLEAGAVVDDQLGLRTMYGGGIHQLCRTSDERAVLSLNQPLSVDNPEEVTRLLPSAPPVPAPRWWLEALAPWGPAGDPGVAIAYEYAARLGGACIVQDGQ